MVWSGRNLTRQLIGWAHIGRDCPTVTPTYISTVNLPPNHSSMDLHVHT